MLYCFAAARFTQIKANDMVKAGSIVQSTVEIIKSFDNSNDMNKYLSGTFSFNAPTENEHIFINYYDKDWNLCDDKNKEYLITVKVNDVYFKAGEMKEIYIIAEKAKPYPFIDKKNKLDDIYIIETKKFFQNNKGEW